MAGPIKLRSFSDNLDLRDWAMEAARKTQGYYLTEQRPDGYWWYELQSNVTITAEYLMLLRLAGIEDKAKERKIANYIMKHQRQDGTWAIHFGGRGDLSTTVEAYFALKLIGNCSDEPHMRKAREFVLENGGVEESRVFTKIFLALFGQFDWKRVPCVPPEILLLPRWVPFNIYNLSAWARATVVPLSLVADHRLVKELPESLGVRELYKEPGKGGTSSMTKGLPFFSRKKFFFILDRLLKAMEEKPVRPLRRRGLEMARTWVLEHQEESGDWLGIQPAMVYSILGLLALGHDVSSEPVKKGLKAIESFTVESDEELMLQSCISPVWDTALTGLALFYSGLDRGHPALLRAVEWLSSRQASKKGDWSIKRPELEPGGWAFEFENTWQPDMDDTSVVLMLLNRYGDTGLVSAASLRRGLNWVLGMQGKDGGWGAFDVDNNNDLANHLPFADHAAMIDPSTPDVTGRVLELLGQIGCGPSEEHVSRALAYLKSTQEKDGLWWGRWGVNYGYGTWSVLVGLRSVGIDMTLPYVRTAVESLKSRQNRDGSWGECCESYADPALRLRGKGTPSQTSWVIMALIAAREGGSEEVRRGISFLLERQKPDGTWDEDEFTGTGFPKHFMLNYYNYRNCFPLMALGRFVSEGAREAAPP